MRRALLAAGSACPPRLAHWMLALGTWQAAPGDGRQRGPWSGLQPSAPHPAWRGSTHPACSCTLCSCALCSCTHCALCRIEELSKKEERRNETLLCVNRLWEELNSCIAFLHYRCVHPSQQAWARTWEREPREKREGAGASCRYWSTAPAPSQGRLHSGGVGVR